MKPLKHTSPLLTIAPFLALLFLVTVGTQRPAQGVQETRATNERSLTPEQAEILSHMKLVLLDDGRGGTTKTILISGVNVQIVNGLGATNGNRLDPVSTDPSLSTTNGLGNLIVGYNEAPPFAAFDRTGSHCIVTGVENSYTSFASITSGQRNLSSAAHTMLLGGSGNEASATHAATIGGVQNEAAAFGSVLAAGGFNLSSAEHAHIGGGFRSRGAGRFSSISGGYKSYTGGDGATVCGGGLCRAEGTSSAISGGYNRVVTGLHDWAAGSLFEDQ